MSLSSKVCNHEFWNNQDQAKNISVIPENIPVAQVGAGPAFWKEMREEVG